MREPKVSVLVPIYNAEQYLEECLDSILGQELKEIEVICINDGSTDGSSHILNEYAKRDERMVVISKPNSGYGHSMNVGLDASRGNYIAIVESDDWIPADMLRVLCEQAQESKLDFVKTDFYRFVTQADGTVREIYNSLSSNKSDYNQVVCPGEVTDTFGFIMNIWSGIYDTSFIKSNQIRFHETPGASFQDNGFWFQTFVLAKRAMFLDRAFYRNRRDNPASSVYDKGKVYAACVEYDHIGEFVKGLKENNKKFAYLCTDARLRNYFFTINRIADEHKQEFYRRFRSDYLEWCDKGEVDESRLPESWRIRLKAIVQDPGKACHSEMLERNKIMDRIRPYQDVIIYGAGANGKAVLNKIKHVGEINRVAYFAVSDRGNNPETVHGIPVREVKSLGKEFKEKALVIIAVQEAYRKEVMQTVEALGFRHWTEGSGILI